MIEDGLTALLLADPTVSGLVNTNIFPVLLPDGVHMAITYRVISSINSYNLDGSTSGLIKSRVEYNSWAPTYSQCKAIAAAIAGSLDSFIGTLPNGVVVSFIQSQNGATDGFDPDTRLYRVQADFIVFYAA